MESGTAASHRASRRKALIIAIQYKDQRLQNHRALHFTHEDARSFKSFIMNQYNYDESEIIVMLDEEGHALAPTRENMLAEIDKFVADVFPGDTLLFYYAGHSTQIPCCHGSEDDELDEAIIASCGNKVIDNELRHRLVSPLQTGVTLVAFIDACHSATMLDLPHYKCHGINFRWKEHKTHDGRVNPSSQGNTRSMPTLGTPSDGVIQVASAGTNAARAEQPEITPQKSKTIATTSESIRRRKIFPGGTTHNGALESEVLNQGRRRTTLQSLAGVVSKVKAGAANWFTKDSPSTCEYEEPEEIGGDEVARSKAVVGRPVCDGKCCPTGPKTGADVISISACMDLELAWENKKRRLTTTQVLIGILRENPNPTYYWLVEELGKKVHKSINQPLIKRYIKNLRKWLNLETDKKPIDPKHGSHPQIASNNPLDPHARLSLHSPGSA